MSYLTLEQRYEIQAYCNKELKKSEISKRLNRPKKTINEEIKLNSNGRNGVYRAALAQRKYEQRKKDTERKVV